MVAGKLPLRWHEPAFFQVLRKIKGWLWKIYEKIMRRVELKTAPFRIDASKILKMNSGKRYPPCIAIPSGGAMRREDRTENRKKSRFP